MSEINSFSEESVQQALAAAKAHNEATGLAATHTNLSLSSGGEYSVLAQCISVTVNNHQVCINLPLGIGHVCLPLPISIPSGTVAQACLSICTTWGIPTGVKVTVSALGHVIVTKTFGKC